jgi:tetratricopeptide (TPR) repeat protein
MATKLKSKSKTVKKAASPRASRPKSIRLKGKAAAKPAPKSRLKKRAKVESRRTQVAPPAPRSTSPERVRSKQFASAVQAYEAAIKLMHAEHFEKAVKGFENLIDDYPDEPEIQERAKVLIHACEKKIHDKGRTVLRSADDHYNVGIADLNRRELDSAIQHLQHALKLTPKADHVLYALAAANALQGNRDQALSYLKQSIHHRQENRFLATRDSDFQNLQEDPDFKQLVTSAEK